MVCEFTIMSSLNISPWVRDKMFNSETNHQFQARTNLGKVVSDKVADQY